MPGATTAVILGGGLGRRFGVLTSRDSPKALLPLGNAPLLSYSVEWVASAGLREAIVVVAGDAAAAAVSRWTSEEYKGACKLTVVAVAEDTGTAGALRAVADRVGHGQVAVISGDLLCDSPLAALLARHRTSCAAATVLLAARRACVSSERKVGRAPLGCDYVGLDAARAQLFFTAASRDVRETLRLPRAALRCAGGVSVHTELVDAQAYVLHASLLALLADRPGFSSLRRELLPLLVRRQFDGRPYLRSAPDGDGAPEGDAARRARALAGPAPGVSRTVCVLLADPCAFVARCDSLRAYLELNRELAAPEQQHITGLSISRHDNFLGQQVELGQKSTVGPGCIVGFASRLGDKVTMKRSVMGRRCRVASGVKISNCVLHDDVVVEEGVTLQGSILGKGAVVGAQASVRDCQVAPGATVPPGAELRNEAVAGPRV